MHQRTLRQSPSKKPNLEWHDRLLLTSLRIDSLVKLQRKLTILVLSLSILLAFFVTFQFQGLPYMNPMSLSDPSLAPLGTAVVTPQQQAQQREMLMNSSMMYLHEVR